MSITLNPGDGMSATKSTPEQRKTVLEILNEITDDRVKYGFYIGTISRSPVADYGGNNVKNEINENNLALM